MCTYIYIQIFMYIYTFLYIYININCFLIYSFYGFYICCVTYAQYNPWFIADQQFFILVFDTIFRPSFMLKFRVNIGKKIMTKIRIYDKKVVTYHPLCHNMQMWKILVILVVINLYPRIDIFWKNVIEVLLGSS